MRDDVNKRLFARSTRATEDQYRILRFPPNCDRELVGNKHGLKCMEVLSMSTKKEKEMPINQRPLRTFREGAVAAHVWKRQTSTGFPYLEFSLSRSWRLKDGKREGYSTNFFEHNEEALMLVSKQATDFIRRFSPDEEHPEPEEHRTNDTASTRGSGKAKDEVMFVSP